MTQAEINVMRIELENMQKKVELMRQLGTREGFFRYYFKQIKNHTSREKAFNYVNGLYFDLYKENRYSDYDSFRKIINRK